MWKCIDKVQELNKKRQVQKLSFDMTIRSTFSNLRSAQNRIVKYNTTNSENKPKFEWQKLQKKGKKTAGMRWYTKHTLNTYIKIITKQGLTECDLKICLLDQWDIYSKLVGRSYAVWSGINPATGWTLSLSGRPRLKMSW